MLMKGINLSDKLCLLSSNLASIWESCDLDCAKTIYQTALNVGNLKFENILGYVWDEWYIHYINE
jgi:hypothetical protein